MPLEKVYYWPAWLTDSLSANKSGRAKIKNKHKISKLKYGWGQIYLWRALNIYDDFLDGNGRTPDLPRANNYFRRFLKIFYQSKLPTSACRELEFLLSDLEKYNRNEAQQSLILSENKGWCLPRRLPDFSNLSCLSRKSLALAIMPLCFLWKIDPILADKKQCELISFFRLALAAKQLADDAKDWEEDLMAKRITPVTIALLQAAKTKKIYLHPTKNLKEVHLIFASLVSQKIATDIIFLGNQARQAAKHCSLKPGAPLLVRLLKPLEKNAKRAIASYRRYQKDLGQIKFEEIKKL